MAFRVFVKNTFLDVQEEVSAARPRSRSSPPRLRHSAQKAVELAKQPPAKGVHTRVALMPSAEGGLPVKIGALSALWPFSKDDCSIESSVAFPDP